MEIFAISGLVNGAAALSFAILVILKDWRDKVNRLYFFMTFSLAVWSFYYWLWLKATIYSDALLYVQLLSVGSLFIPVFFFHWIVAYLKQEEKHKYLIIASYVLSIVILFFFKSDLFIAGLSKQLFFEFWPSAGLIYKIYFYLIYVGLILYSWRLLFKARKDPSYADKKGQISYLILGSLIGFGGGFTNFPLWFGIPLPPYGNFLVAVFPFTFFYSMYKNKLFSTKTITTEIAVFLLSEILLVKTILSNSIGELILQIIIFVLTVVFGIIIVRSVYKEIEQREQIEQLATKLEASNEALAGANQGLADANRSLGVANDKLKELDQLKSEFVSLATHQIRGPLTAIKGYVSMVLEGDYGRVTKQVKEAMSYILQSTQSLVVIVGDFLDVSRIEQGRMKYDFKNFDFRKLVTEIVNELRPNIDKAGLDFTFSADEKEKYLVNGDEIKLKQVIANIIDNSVKYTPKGSVKVTVEKTNGLIKFAVKDTGVGIPADTLPRLFAKFSRAQDASLTNTSGTGLGLYLAKAIIEAHKGKIWAESAGKGKGSQFYVELLEVKG